MTVEDRSAEGRESMLLRGTLDMCVLALLATETNHAYGVVERLQGQGFAQTSYGTVYPLVSRLRRQGLLHQVSRPGAGGPAKNVLSVTKLGRDSLRAWEQQWHDFNARVSDLLEASAIDNPSKGVSHV